ncbi:MAG: HlyD family efflux transporter periplasmic adaptor subunit, partial [Kofleriaceae bacterium]
MRLAVVALIAACGSEPISVPQPVARTVDAGVVVPPDAPTRFVGVLTAAESVDVSPRVAGLIAKVYFGPGDKVEAGELVVEMDPQQMREELRAAEAALAAAGAAARQAGVDVEDARRKVALETKAVAQGISASSVLDEARLGVKRAEAAYQRAQSAAAAERARAQTARDHVNNTGLRAPFAGTVAARYRDAGNRVESGSPIMRIVGHGKMRLRFAVPVDQV